MSNWTHVIGSIRIDTLRGITDNTPFDTDKIFGKECLFESSKEIWDDMDKHPEDYLPMGSEGSLQKSVYENPDRSVTAAYTVTIFGDLRDHDNAGDIIKWFENKLNNLPDGYWIRQAVITADNECNGVETYTYEEKE